MKLDKKIMEEKIREYREFKSCSESTLMGLCETAEYPMTQAEMCKGRKNEKIFGDFIFWSGFRSTWDRSRRSHSFGLFQQHSVGIGKSQ